MLQNKSDNEKIYSDKDDVEELLTTVLNRGLRCLVKGVESGNIETGMIAKNLEVDQACIIAENLDYFTRDELNSYMNEFSIDSSGDTVKDKLIDDTKRSNLKIGFIIQKLKAKKPEMIVGVI